MTIEQNAQEITVKKKVNTEEQEKRMQLFVIWLAGVFILAGLVFGANSQGLLPEITAQNEWDKIEWADWVLLGAGLWGLAINFFRINSPNWPLPTVFDWIGSIGLALVGASQILDTDTETGELVGAVAMISLGVAILFITVRKINQE